MDFFFEILVGVGDVLVEMTIMSYHVDSVRSHGGNSISSVAIFDIILTQILIFGIIILTFHLFSRSEATKPWLSRAYSFSRFIKSKSFDRTLDQNRAGDLFPA